MSEEWIEISARGRAGAKDEAVRILIEAGSPGVLEEEVEGRAPAKAPAAYKAYIKPGREEVLELLRKRLKRIGWTISTSLYRDSDWSVKWRSGIRPAKVFCRGCSLVVKPTWSLIRRRPGAVVVEIDPSMAFGTGGHHTTRLCLKAVLRLLKGVYRHSIPSMLDVGTGTGVIAIAARKLGAGRCVGLDTDRVALKVARENVRHNRVDVTISAMPVERLSGRFDIVVSNIVSGELKRLAPVLERKVRPGGFIVLSGILREEAGSVVAAYAATGLKFLKKYTGGEWAAVVLGKSPI